MQALPNPPTPSKLRLRRLGIDTYQEPVLFMHRDCRVCHSEGFEAQSRVELALGERTIVATLNVVSGDFLAPDEAGLSEAAWRLLNGRRLTQAAITAVIEDVAAGRY